MMDPTEDALNRYVRAGMRGLRKPAAGSDSVFNDECMVSFDSPFSPGGLYVNLRTFQGFGKDFLGSDLAARDSGDVPALYVHSRKQRVPRVGGAAARRGPRRGIPPRRRKWRLRCRGLQTDEQSTRLSPRRPLYHHRDWGLRDLALPSEKIPEFVSGG